MIVELRIKVSEQSDPEQAIRLALWRLKEVKAADIMSDRYGDIDRQIKKDVERYVN